jgi:hypothetical protein
MMPVMHAPTSSLIPTGSAADGLSQRNFSNGGQLRTELFLVELKRTGDYPAGQIPDAPVTGKAIRQDRF